MGIIHPNWDTIKQLHQKATEGELHLLRFLEKNLDESYEIFFQANINGDRPDIVIMRKDSGVLIIEVKDWDLRSYRNDNGKWSVIKNGNKSWIRSPFTQVTTYKEILNYIYQTK